MTALSDELAAADVLSADAFRAFHRALRLHRRVLMQALAEHGIHHGQAMCLRLLASGGELTQRDLACELHVSSPTVTRMVGSMERAGLVRRRPDTTDARLVRVELTDAGRRQEREMRAAAAAYTECTFARLSEGERRELARLLDKLSDIIAEVAEVAADRRATPGGQATGPSDPAPDQGTAP